MSFYTFFVLLKLIVITGNVKTLTKVQTEAKRNEVSYDTQNYIID